MSVNRSSGATSETVYVSTTQTEGYSNNSDYVGLLEQAYTFNAGVTSRTVWISIINNSVFESTETFGLIVQRNASDPVSVYLAKATFTIFDND
jgi:hypothetical protein